MYEEYSRLGYLGRPLAYSPPSSDEKCMVDDGHHVSRRYQDT